MIGATLMCGTSTAAARPVIVELDGAAPFDAAQLTAALEVRLAGASGAGEAPIRVVVQSAPGGVVVAIGGAERTVALAGHDGTAAARLVALAASDLVLDDLAVLPVLAAPSVLPPSVSLSVVAPPPRAEDKKPSTTVGILGGAAAWDGDGVLGGITVDIAVPRGAWLATLDLGGATLIDGPIHVAGAVIRGAGGRRIGPLDLRAGVTLVPLSVSDGDGDRTVLVGAGASARLRLAIGDGTHLVIGGGLDAFATRTAYTMNGAAVGTTPWWSPWLAAGVELTP
jgi:hypothetical protein